MCSRLRCTTCKFACYMWEGYTTQVSAQLGLKLRFTHRRRRCAVPRSAGSLHHPGHAHDTYKVNSLQTFVCDGVAARFDDPPALYAILDTLMDTYKVKSLQTFVCSGVAARFDDPPALYAILDTLVDTYKVKSLQTFVCKEGTTVATCCDNSASP